MRYFALRRLAYISPLAHRYHLIAVSLGLKLISLSFLSPFIRNYTYVVAMATVAVVIVVCSVLLLFLVVPLSLV